MLYTTRTVFSNHHGEAAYTRHTALCSARITVVRGEARGGTHTDTHM